jgi:hypothetical protein
MFTKTIQLQLVLSIIVIGSSFSSYAVETPPQYKASEILPTDLLKSNVHTVRDAVQSENYMFEFKVESQFGLYEIESLELLKIRIHEIKTLANAVGSSQTDEYLSALGNSLKQTANAPVRLIQDPIGTVEAVGKGISKTFSRIGNLFKKREKSEHEDDGFKESLIGSEKRKAAAELKLDVYSSNSKVQEFLNKVAEARASGALTFRLATLAIPGGAGLAVGAASFSGSVEDMLRDNDPKELHVINEKTLQQEGFESFLIDEFLSHKHLSPRHKTVMVLALKDLHGVTGREEIVKVAIKRTTQQEAMALFQMNRLVMLSEYHKKNPIQKIEQINEIPIITLQNNKKALVLPIDILYWADDPETILTGLAKEKNLDILVLSGKATELTKQKLSEMNVRLVENYRIK